MPLIPFLIVARASQAQRSERERRWDDSCARPRPAAPEKDVVETAVAAGRFKTLATALEAADLVGALQGDGPFTVLAPTDDAFARLPEGALDELLGDKEKLAAVLKYHVIPGRLTSTDLKAVGSARTLEGGTIEVDTSIGVRVGPAYVVAPDIRCKNGIVHAIDAVLLPD